MSVQPFTLPNDAARLARIANRVAEFEWFDGPQLGADEDPWAYGTDAAYLKSLCNYWLSDYRWEDTLAELHKFDHFTAQVEDIKLHFIHEVGSGTNPRALLMSHGWPGSVYEFLHVIEPLAHPERFGGNAEDGVSVICPSIPGYGFSSKPSRPIGPKRTAELFDKLMREHLGFETYVAQGGDWGSVITGLIGYHHSVAKGGGCTAIHINMYGLRGSEVPQTDDEIKWAEHTAATMQAEGAYLQIQGTKPQSLAYAMMDSPVGTCAWIIEKFHGWSDNIGADGRRHIEQAYTKHQLLSNVMIYLMTGSFATSVWFYRGFFEELPFIGEGEKVDVPVGIGNFAEPYITFPPRRMVEHSYNIVHWLDFETAGHFAALEDGEQFVGAVQSFLKKL
jgi:pimeloyl-ACP methyl ester carboxylesterase